MMDQNFLNSVLASNGSGAATEARSKETKVDADAFGTALADADKPAKGKNTKKADAEEAKAERKKEERTKQEVADEHKAKTQDPGAAARMQKLLHKNVDTLSLAEKQALRVAEFAGDVLQPTRVNAAPKAALAAPAGPGVAAGRTPAARGKTGESASEKTEPVASRVDREKVEDRKSKADEATREHGKGAPTLEQSAARESKFTDELQKSQGADRQHERQNLIDQILAQVEVKNFAARTEISLKLNPEYLGDLRIKLTHADEGVRAEFESSSRDTRELLREGEDDLRAQASAKGVRLGAMRFMVVDRGAGTPT